MYKMPKYLMLSNLSSFTDITNTLIVYLENLGEKVKQKKGAHICYNLKLELFFKIILRDDA